jgi:hypothetical protein
MYGRDTQQSGVKTAQIAPTPPGSSSNTYNRLGSVGSADTSTATFPFLLIVLVALYFFWAIIEQHEKLKSAIQPKHIGINLRNLLVIMVTVVLGLNVFKIGAVKLSAALARATGGRVRARWLVLIAGGA